MTGTVTSADIRQPEGVVTIRGTGSAGEIVDKLRNLLQSKGITLFALIDHSGEAEKVGMTMPPTKLLIFGNPKAGTPLMLASPSLAINLPLKILVWEDGQGRAWLSYNSAEYLAQRHGLQENLTSALAAAAALAQLAAVAEKTGECGSSRISPGLMD